MDSDILTIRDMATYLKVTEKTVYGLAQQRRIPSFKVGGQWRFRRDHIEAWIGVQTKDTRNATSSALANAKRGRARRIRPT